MIKVIILLIVYLILLAISNALSYKGFILTPQFGLLVGFIAQAIYAIMWVDAWDLDPSASTMGVLAGGIGFFVILGLWFQHIGVRYSLRIKTSKSSANSMDSANAFSKSINIQLWKYIAIFAFQCVVLILLLLFVRRLVSGSLSEAIYFYRETTAHTDNEIYMPMWLSLLRQFTVASGYIWVYLLVHGIVFKYNAHFVFLTLNIVASTLTFIVLGSRSGLFNYVIAAVVFTYLFLSIKNNWRYRVRLKTILKIVAVFFVFVLTFQAFGSILGQKQTRDLDEYIAIYLSAEIKNLDLFIRNEPMGMGGDLYTTKTFVNLANFLSGRLGLPIYRHRLINPYQYVNRHSLGNVSTMMYAPLYDFGYGGLFICLFFMAIIGEIMFLKVIKRRKRYKRIDMHILMYGFIYYAFVFSFFSNKFYEMLFNPGMIYRLIAWFLIRWFLENVHIGKSGL